MKTFDGQPVYEVNYYDGKASMLFTYDGQEQGGSTSNPCAGFLRVKSAAAELRSLQEVVKLTIRA